MDLSSDKIPNKMLLGSELLEIAVKEFRQMLTQDCMFTKGIAYRRVAFTLQGTFHFGYPLPPDHVVKSRVKAEGAVEGEVPLNPLPPDDEGGLVALERDINLDNPNLARVTHDLPIIVQERVPPQSVPTTGGIPGETPSAVTNPYPKIVNHELKYDKTQYPEGPKPVDRDVSEAKAAELGIKTRKKG